MSQEPVATPVEDASRIVTINLRLARLDQLFNSLDPSPFHEKDLDADAEEYILGWVREAHSDGPAVIAIHMPGDEARRVDADQLQTSIRNYFRYREDVTARELRIFLRAGRRSLALGLVVLIVAVGARELMLELLPGAPGRILGEGMLIGGWVAMWQPVQSFIYDWRPLRARRTALHRLSQARVEIRPETAAA